MLEETLATVINQFPNFAALFIMLYWQKQTIDKLLNTQTQLVDRLLTLTETHTASEPQSAPEES